MLILKYILVLWDETKIKQKYNAFSEVTSNNIFGFRLKYELPNLVSAAQFLK